MNKVFWLLKWVLKAVIFFTLFAFALNNQQDTTVHFFFGTTWKTSLVMIVLVTFASGVVVGVLGMVPRWWRHRQVVKKISQEISANNVHSNVTSSAAQDRHIVSKKSTTSTQTHDYMPKTQ